MNETQIGERILFNDVLRLMREIEGVNGTIISLDLPIQFSKDHREIKERLYKLLEFLGQRFDDARKDKAA